MLPFNTAVLERQGVLLVCEAALAVPHLDSESKMQRADQLIQVDQMRVVRQDIRASKTDFPRSRINLKLVGRSGYLHIY